MFNIDVAQPSQSYEHGNLDTENPYVLDDDDHNHEFHIGRWVGKSNTMTTEQKTNILKNCWKAPVSYDCSKDSIDSKRKFRHAWLEIYKPWLVYSEKLKGAFCLNCVLFPPTVVKGVLGALTVTPCDRYKDMIEFCKRHASSQWHQNSTMAAKRFLEDVPIDVQMVTGHQEMIERNRKMLLSII